MKRARINRGLAALIAACVGLIAGCGQRNTAAGGEPGTGGAAMQQQQSQAQQATLQRQQAQAAAQVAATRQALSSQPIPPQPRP